MAGLSLIVFPVLGFIGVAKHLSTPSNKRTEKSTTYFKRYLLGIFLTWIGFEFKGQLDPIIVSVVALVGIYLCLFNGIWLFGEDPIKDTVEVKSDNKIQQESSPIFEKKLNNKVSTTSTSDAIIASQKRLYDEGIWLAKNVSLNSSIKNSRVIETISGKGWKYDKDLRILWNQTTNEILHSSSGLGFSIADGYFFLYNKIEPRKIQVSEVICDNFKS